MDGKTVCGAPHAPIVAFTAKSIARSWAFVLTVGAVLWPPGVVYWEPVATIIGDGATLLLVGVVAVGIGAAFIRIATIDMASFIVGGVLAYLTGMAVLELALSPESPAHFVLYAGLLGCLIGGGSLYLRSLGTNSEEMATRN